MNPAEIPDSIAVVNGKRYSLWPQFVMQKADFIGGLLTELDPDVGKPIQTTIKDITFTPNGKDSAMFTVAGEDFDCCADVTVLGVDGGGNLPGINFVTRWHQFAIQKRIAVPEGMKEFFFTFGQKYRMESHPQGGHPDGYFTIVAPDEEQAREAMFKECGPAWSHNYAERPSLDRYPRGELRRITVVPKPTNTETNESKPTN